MNKYSSKEARKVAEELNALHNSYGPVKERVQYPKRDAYYSLMELVFRGTDIVDIAQYPKRTGKQPF